MLARLIAAATRTAFADLSVICTSQSLASRRGPVASFSANYARSLIMPTKGLALSLKQIRTLLGVTNPELGDVEIIYLSRIFGLTFLDTAIACERCQLLPSGGASSFEKFMIERFGGAEQRAFQLALPRQAEARFDDVPPVIASAIARRWKMERFPRKRRL